MKWIGSSHLLDSKYIAGAMAKVKPPAFCAYRKTIRSVAYGFNLTIGHLSTPNCSKWQDGSQSAKMQAGEVVRLEFLIRVCK
jgi:hypothetical protein